MHNYLWFPLIQQFYFKELILQIFFHKWIKILNLPFLLKKKQMFINTGVFSVIYIVWYLLEIVPSIFTQLVNI